MWVVLKEEGLQSSESEVEVGGGAGGGAAVGDGGCILSGQGGTPGQFGTKEGRVVQAASRFWVKGLEFRVHRSYLKIKFRNLKL